jgi:phosphohistidine phosphatase
MNRELILLRHGKSDWNTNTDDFHRPLNKRGIQGAKHVGIWLLEQQLVPDTIISSPAERAIDTAKKACEMMQLNEQCIHQEQRLYDADLEILIQTLSLLSNNAQRVLLVGHNPGLAELLIYLSGKQIKTPEDHKILPTATLARLDIPTPWDKIDENCAELLEIKRPDK